MKNKPVCPLCFGVKRSCDHASICIVTDCNNVILHTKRVGNELEDAVRWFRDNNIELFGVNENPSRKLWSGNSKVYATRYIDSESLGTPLDLDGNVDWVLMTELIKENMMLFERRY